VVGSDSLSLLSSVVSPQDFGRKLPDMPAHVLQLRNRAQVAAAAVSSLVSPVDLRCALNVSFSLLTINPVRFSSSSRAMSSSLPMNAVASSNAAWATERPVGSGASPG
jgi:hypothetical protein